MPVRRLSGLSTDIIPTCANDLRGCAVIRQENLIVRVGNGFAYNAAIQQLRVARGTPGAFDQVRHAGRV
jgi:hypothetical protein